MAENSQYSLYGEDEYGPEDDQYEPSEQALREDDQPQDNVVEDILQKTEPQDDLLKTNTNYHTSKTREA